MLAMNNASHATLNIRGVYRGAIYTGYANIEIENHEPTVMESFPSLYRDRKFSQGLLPRILEEKV